ncbi:hypothetical protein [Bartonella vinsonii]|uniref:hypothetical protein n=1 Tax=Bartonella vinsonii TaxID=33047 RepID=UPI0003488E17|nr:hypothetical protein [Bartonella vinsonii]
MNKKRSALRLSPVRNARMYEKNIPYIVITEQQKTKGSAEPKTVLFTFRLILPFS